MHTGKTITNYKTLTMIHLTDKWEEKRLPKFKAFVVLRTLNNAYKVAINATYFDLCLMTLSKDWVIQWFYKKASSAKLRKFIKIETEGITFTEVIVEGSIEKDIHFGLEHVSPRVIWANDSPFMCGAVTLFRLERFIMASIYYTSSYASNDIRYLVRDVIVHSIVESYKFDSEDRMVWSFGSGSVRDSLIRLRKYFRPLK